MPTVYLRCPIDVLKQRIQRRARPEERTIDWDFVEDKQRRYDDYLYYKNSSFPTPSKVIVLDGSLSLENFALNVHNQLPTLFPSWKLLRGLQRMKTGRNKKLWIYTLLSKPRNWNYTEESYSSFNFQQLSSVNSIVSQIICIFSMSQSGLCKFLCDVGI